MTALSSLPAVLVLNYGSISLGGISVAFWFFRQGKGSSLATAFFTAAFVAFLLTLGAAQIVPAIGAPAMESAFLFLWLIPLGLGILAALADAPGGTASCWGWFVLAPFACVAALAGKAVPSWLPTVGITAQIALAVPTLALLVLLWNRTRGAARIALVTLAVLSAEGLVASPRTLHHFFAGTLWETARLTAYQAWFVLVLGAAWQRIAGRMPGRVVLFFALGAAFSIGSFAIGGLIEALGRADDTVPSTAVANLVSPFFIGWRIGLAFWSIAAVLFIIHFLSWNRRLSDGATFENGAVQKPESETPLWFIFAVGFLAMWSLGYLFLFNNGFSADPPDNESALGTEIAGLTPLERGQRVYRVSCARCHGVDGQGLPGQYPPLAGSEIVLGQNGYRPADAERIVLGGLVDPVTIRGNPYNGMMAAWRHTLNDAEIAAVLTYVRQAWGNNAPPIAPSDIATLRATMLNRYAPWTVQELRALQP